MNATAESQEVEFERELTRLNDDEPELPKPAVRQLVDRAVFVSIKLAKPGASKQIDSSRITFNGDDEVAQQDAAQLEIGKDTGDGVDRNMIVVSKKLMDCPEFKAITKIDGALKRYITSRCSPSLIRNGVFLLSVALVNEVDKQVQGYKKQREQAIAAYGEVYDKRVEEALKRLGSEGNRSDYPPWSIVEQAFACEVQYISFGVPTVLGNVNQEIFEREQARVAAQFENALEIGKQGLRSMMAELVSTLSDKLTTDPTEGKKRFHASLVDKFQDFLRVFEARNLADDRELAGLVEKSKSLLEGVSVKELKSDNDVRQFVQKGLTEIKDSLGELVIGQPTRKITFDD